MLTKIMLVAAFFLSFGLQAGAQKPGPNDSGVANITISGAWTSCTATTAGTACADYSDLVVSARDGQQVLFRKIAACKEIADLLMKSADVTRAKCFAQ